MLPQVYDAVVSTSTTRQAFEGAVVAGLAAVGVPSSAITEVDIHPGSVLVIVFAEPAAALEPAHKALAAGRLIVSSIAAEPAATTGSGSGASGASDGGNEAAISTALIAAIAVAGIVILVLVVVLVRRSRASTAGTARVGAFSPRDELNPVSQKAPVGLFLNPVYSDGQERANETPGTNEGFGFVEQC
jgi:hypothetical protein